MIALMIGGPKDQHFWKVGPSPSESCSLFLENGWSSARAAPATLWTRPHVFQQ